MDVETNLIPFQKQEVEISFPLIQRLFDKGRDVFGGVDNGSSSDYYNADDVVVKSVKLPEEFSPLTLGDDPNKYFLVYFDDRTSPYYKEKGGQKKSACIATQKRSYESNDRLKEITYSSEDSGFYLTVAEKINNRAYEEFYDEDREGLVKPNGRIKAKYRLAGGSGKELIELTSSRVDEVMFPNQDGQKQPGRWLRELLIDAEKNETIYKELYILNRAAPSVEKRDEKRAQVSFKMYGKTESSQKIDVIIGYGFLAESSSRVVFEDKEKGVRVILPDGFETDLEILRSDPNYAFLQEGQFDAGKVQDFVSERVALLQKQWDQPQSVFEQTTIESSQDKPQLSVD